MRAYRRNLERRKQRRKRHKKRRRPKSRRERKRRLLGEELRKTKLPPRPRVLPISKRSSRQRA